MSMSKTISKVVTSKPTISTVAVDVPGRPDLVYVYTQMHNNRSKRFEKKLMLRDVFDAAQSVEEMHHYTPLYNGNPMRPMLMSKERFNEMNPLVPATMLIGDDPTFGQEINEDWVLLFVCSQPDNKPLIFTKPDGTPVYINPREQIVAPYFDVKKFYEEHKDNPAFNFIPARNDGVFVSHWSGVEYVTVSVVLSEEQHKALQDVQIHNSGVLRFLAANTVIGQYQIKELPDYADKF